MKIFCCSTFFFFRIRKKITVNFKVSWMIQKNVEQLNRMKNLENSEKEHKKQFLFEGQIVASVEKGLLINAEIKLKTKFGTLDTSKNKVIVSTSDAKILGNEAYEKGEPITSLHMKSYKQ